MPIQPLHADLLGSQVCSVWTRERQQGIDVRDVIGRWRGVCSMNFDNSIRVMEKTIFITIGRYP